MAEHFKNDLLFEMVSLFFFPASASCQATTKNRQPWSGVLL
jgi:hypothetical protein